MEGKVKLAFNAGIQAYAKTEQIDGAAFSTELAKAFELDKPFVDKVAALDAVFDDHQQFEELREIYFDLLMINFFAEDVQKLEGDYLDSPEWEAIEEDTIDRGTELLNIFLYLRECADDEIEPSLDDYLKEFLLVEEDEFQDEYNIYETVIANQILVDSTYPEISKVAESLSFNDDMKELFYPVMSFFNEQKPTDAQFDEFVKASQNRALDLATYQIIVNFNK
ncbi:hypothetical protein E2P86_10780 [Sphingobacterium psychroaquaticum]|uniref:hypothetical protein n=1 Tax=Sphingobacterium psychroaquaticum TaxID=561061 RepID=UPI00106D9530|nr:hypothetical protein [Sphingobacterium psychroaquaticum]QBQ41607.1 hypothetical protein E2P86_10780 [Sphingobacterium psychroaquaticum]